MYKTVLCPNCSFPNRLVSVQPSLEQGVDELTYHCAVCAEELTRSISAKAFDGPQRRATNPGPPPTPPGSGDGS
jgi:hypothetical protein